MENNRIGSRSGHFVQVTFNSIGTKLASFEQAINQRKHILYLWGLGEPLPTENRLSTPLPVVYDGEWEGLTGQDLPVTFFVKDNTVETFHAEYRHPDCDLAVVEPNNYPGGVKIERDIFKFTLSGFELSGYGWEFFGKFGSSTQAAGVFTAFLGKCNVDTTWEATRK